MPILSWTVNRPARPIFDGPYAPSSHALERMAERCIQPDDVEAVLTYGQPVYDRGALVFRLGQKQIRQYADVDVLQHLEGLHVVCSTVDGTVMTVYRNMEFRAPRKTHRAHKDRRPIR